MWSDVVPPIIVAVSSLAGVYLGRQVTSRHFIVELMETRRLELSTATSTFIRETNRIQGQLHEHLYASEATNIELQKQEKDPSTKRRAYQIEANRIAGFIDRYLGDLRGQSLALRLVTKNKELLDALDDFDASIEEAFVELVEVQDAQEEQGNKLAATFRQLVRELREVSEAQSPLSDKEIEFLTAHTDETSAQLDKSLAAWRSNLVHTAINFRVNQEFKTVLEAGKHAVEEIETEYSQSLKKKWGPFSKSRQKE